MFDDAGDARRIIFLCDVDISMHDRFDELKDEIIAAVQRLSPDQAFNVVLAADGSPEMFSELGPMPASDEMKLHFEDFMSGVTTAASSTDAHAALIEAVRQRPDLIFLVSNGDFINNAVMIRDARRGDEVTTRTKPARVNTVLFVPEAGSDPQSAAGMAAIAAALGGTFREVVPRLQPSWWHMEARPRLPEPPWPFGEVDEEEERARPPLQPLIPLE
jgi:hypothetical protein